MKYTQSHTTKYIFALGLLAGFASIANSSEQALKLSDESVIASYQGKDGAWQYLEYKFMIEPNNKTDYLMRHASSSVGAAGAAALGIKALTNKHIELSSDNLLKNIVLTLSAVAVGHTAHSYLQCYIKRSVRKEALENMLQNWGTHRKHLPIQFVEMLDELFTMYQERGSEILTASVICQVFSLVQHHLEHHFSDRYKKDEIKHETNLNNFKSLTEVLKNLA